MKKPKIPPALALFVLAPAIGELLSGSSPPAEFFNLFSFLLLASLYGSGAIVVRELKTRWKKDFKSLLLLGAAYGILEEGLMVKSFFDPSWMDLGILGSFGRWADVNWVWAEMLIIYHAVFSITIPIVLVELAYPERKNENWIGKRAFTGFTVLLAVVAAIGFFLLTLYVPPLSQYLLAVLAMGMFGCTAYRLPAGREATETKKMGKEWSLWLAGLTSTTAFFLLFWAGPYLLNQPVIIMILGIILVFGMLKILKRFNWEASEASLNRLAIASGALSFLIILAPLQERDARRKDDPAGMTIVALAAIVALLLLRRKVKKSV